MRSVALRPILADGLPLQPCARGTYEVYDSFAALELDSLDLLAVPILDDQRALDRFGTDQLLFQ